MIKFNNSASRSALSLSVGGTDDTNTLSQESVPASQEFVSALPTMPRLTATLAPRHEAAVDSVFADEDSEAAAFPMASQLNAGTAMRPFTTAASYRSASTDSIELDRWGDTDRRELPMVDFT